MAGKGRRRLTDAAIARLWARSRGYTVWDSAVPGLGVRVRPGGGNSYVLLRQSSVRSRRTSLGPVLAKDIDEVRRECHSRMADPESEQTDDRKRDVPLFPDFVERPWKKAHFDRYKPSTRRSTRIVLIRWVLPAFGSKPLDRIAPEEVGRWFDAYSRTSPGGVNRILSILQQIMNLAIDCGHIETNLPRGVKRNRRTRGGDVHADRHCQGKQRRFPDLARRCSRPDRRDAAGPARRTPPLELSGQPATRSGRIGRDPRRFRERRRATCRWRW